MNTRDLLTLALFTGASASDLLDAVNKAKGAANDYASKVNKQANAKKFGLKQNFGVSGDIFDGLTNALHNFGDIFKNCDSSDITPQFNGDFCDFESSLITSLNSLVANGNSFGGYSWVQSCTWTLWIEYWDICGDFGGKGDCDDIGSIWDTHCELTDIFYSISKAWNFGGNGCTLPTFNPFPDTCKTTTPSLPASKTSVKPPPPSSPTSPSVKPSSPTSPTGKPTSPTSPSASPSSPTSPSEKPSSPTTTPIVPTTHSTPTTPATKPNPPSDTTTFSTFTDRTTTYRCKVNGKGDAEQTAVVY